MNFEGTYVAMVTPFTEDKKIDEEGFRSNINYLIDNCVNGLLGAATTGESATLTHDEHKRIIEILIDEVDGRVETLAGAGSNSTKEALDLAEFSENAGADAALVITPYYNKPQPHGLVEHFKTVAEATDIPIIAYNVPSRTGINMDIDTIIEIAKIDNVDAIKEASGSIEKINDIYRALSNEGLEDDFTILSGEDSLTLPIMALGGKGVISASANVDSKRMVLMVDSMLNDDYQRAMEIHYDMLDLMRVMFVESNPVPAKTAMNIMGLPSGPLRKPLAPMKEENVETLKKVLKEANLI